MLYKSGYSLYKKAKKLFKIRNSTTPFPRQHIAGIERWLGKGNCCVSAIWMQFADFEVIICWVFVYAALLEKLYSQMRPQAKLRGGAENYSHRQHMQKQHGEKFSLLLTPESQMGVTEEQRTIPTDNTCKNNMVKNSACSYTRVSNGSYM